MMTDASRQLVALARKIAAAYLSEAGPRAILLAGSAAEGVSDTYSDIDLILYYDRLPSERRLASVRDKVHAVDVQAPVGQADETSFIEEYVVRGVTCQLLHVTIAEWERQMGTVLEDHSPTSLAHKAIGGLLDGIPLHGDDLIGRWQARASAYPDGLVRAMVLHHLQFFPLWLVQERLATRDATRWYYAEIVASSQNILGVLAGLNRRYYSAFQFKRQGSFIGKLTIAPERLAARLDALFVLDRASAAIELERLVGETVALVEAHLPDVDTTPVRRLLGARQRPWSLASDITS
jgi:hypothetical protein